MMLPRNQRIILTDQIRRNVAEICANVPSGTIVMAVVKADGYGHGAVETAKAALKGGAGMLATATVSEGTELRENGIQAPILVLGAVGEEDVEEGVRSNLIQTVCSQKMVRMCEESAKKLSKQTEVHIKIDTGMGRIGVRNETERDRVMDEIRHSDHIRLAGAFTHFADADGGEEGMLYTEAQFQRFLKLTEPLPEGIIRHCSNSAAIERRPDMALDMVRAGISMYGYPPVETKRLFKPCMRWVARVSYVKEVPEGTDISYGRIWRAGRTTRIATLTCGYGDGYHRCATGKAEVLIRGRRARIIGRICMDQMMADVTDIPDVEAGDEVVLIGTSGTERIDAEDVARWADTISYEVLLSAGNRVNRVYK